MKNRSLILYSLLFLVLTYCIMYLTPFTGLNHDFSELITFMRLAYIAIAILILFKILHLVINGEFKELVKKITLAITSIITLTFVLEVAFMFVPHSHGAGGEESLAARLWFSKYWEVNSLGYRDKEISDEDGNNKFNIAIVGDSFVAGHGIKAPASRFSNVLQTKLSDAYRVHNLGLNGADTQVEYAKLVQFPIKPNLIILSHHPNDIMRVPRSTAGLQKDENSTWSITASFLPLSIGESLVKNSYLVNYFFWKFNPATSLDENIQIAGAEYFGSQAGQSSHLSAYLDESVYSQHLQNIYQFVLLSREESIPLVVILFPETWDETIEFSEAYANKPIEAFLQREGIPVLDLYNIVKSIPVRDRVVNDNDAHPSELVHQKVADALGDFLMESKLIK